jgi:hypothetical protein
MRQRRELEEGWRKQKEQEAEERARATEEVRVEEMRKWGCSVDAGAGQVPATKTTPLEEEATTTNRNGGLLDWLGWDGRQQQDDKQVESTRWNGPLTMPSVRMTVPENDKSKSLNPFSGNMSEAVSWLLTNEYSPVFLRGHIPKDIHHGGPSFYHALHHPHWPDFRAASSPDRFEDELRFRVPWCDAFEDLVSLQHKGHMIDRDEPTRTSSAQWLNDMIKRGSLGEIMSRGVVGPQWSTEYARTVLPFNSGRQPQHIPSSPAPPFDPIEHPCDDEDEFDPDPVLTAFDIIKHIADLDDGTDGFGDPKHWVGEISDSLIQAVAKDLMKPGVLDELRRLGFTSEAQVMKYLLGVGTDSDPSHGFLMAPPDVVAAAMRAAAASETEPSRTESIAKDPHHKVTAKENQTQPMTPKDRDKALVMTVHEKDASSPPIDHSSNPEKADESPSFTSSSSSTSSWSRWGSQEEDKDSIISTMTTTERRTLPDGTVETKRVLKKKFADGREESNEIVERQMSPSADPRSAASKPLGNGVSSTARQDKETQTDVKENPRAQRSGWFWRE